MLSLTLLTFSTLTGAFLLPPAFHSITSPAANLASKCTFTLYHRQQSSVNYIQLNGIKDHANDITIDVASRRPAAAFNSYTRIDRAHAFAVAGLLDDTRLTVMYDEGEVLRFEVGETKWSEGGPDGEDASREMKGEAWCDAQEWKGGADRRERRLDCVFPCAQVASEDLQQEEFEHARVEQNQARIRWD